MKKQGSWIAFCTMICVSVLLLAQWGSNAVTAWVENAPIERACCIVIDPGHGGEDGGATSCTGIPESTYNLEISLRLNDLLHLLGLETKMTRTSDVSVYTKGETIAQKKVSDLRERVRIVNDMENALLISIHQNNFGENKYSGAQVFYANSKDSALFAKQLQDNLVAHLNTGSNRRQKRSEGIYLMEHIQCTGVLIECGFLSNPVEEANLRNPAYQKKICSIIAATVKQYLSNT